MNSAVPDGWKLLPIGDVTSFSQGIQVDVEQHHETEDDSKVRFVRISDYTKSDEPPRYIDSALALKGLVEKDDVVMIRYGEAGRVCRGIVGAIANNLFTIGPKSILEKEYLFQYLKSTDVSQRIGELAASSAMPAISFSSLKCINLTVPPLPEQKKIASILTSVDEVIENTQKQIDKLQDLKKATMNELLTKGIGHTEFKDSELGRIPKSWEVKLIGEIVNRIDGGGTPSRINDRYWNGNIPWATVKDLTGNFLNSTEESISKDGLDESSSKLIPADTVIIATRMAVGKAVVFDREVAINQDLKALFPSKSIDSKFLHHWFLSQANYIESLGTGSTVKGVRLEHLRELKVSLPPLPEQQKIVSILSSMDSHIEEKQRKLHQTQSLKKSLMQDLLTGKVRVMVN